MNEEEYIALIYKSIKGEISPSESAVLDKHTALSEENEILRMDIEDSWLFSQDNSAVLDTIDVEQDLQIVSDKINQEKNKTVIITESSTSVHPNESSKTIPINRRFNMRRLAIAASFLLLAVAGFLYTGIGDTHETSVYASYNKPIQIDLDDGSMVTLNKNSKLIVSKEFSKTNRTVELEGEAFFVVESSQAHAFEIGSGKSIVTVLGTKFNVRTSKENCVVSVTSGKVKLEDSGRTNEVILVKDEVGRHTYGDGRVIKHKVSSSNMTYWQKENVVFRNTALSEVINELQLMYDASIQIENKDISECKISLVSNDITIDKVLSKVCLSLDAQLESIDNETFVIKNGTCK